MKRRTGIYISMVMMALLFLTASCIKKEEKATEGKIPVSITFSGRNGIDAGAGGNQKEDGIRTLRIIVAESGTNRIIYNHPCPVRPDGSSHITFELLPGMYDFYMVANEAAVAYPGIESMNVDVTELEGYILERSDAGDYLSEGGIPFSEVRKGVKVTDRGIALGPVVMKRALSRICLSFVNTTGKEQTVENIKIEGAKADKGYLFFNESKQAATRFDPLEFGTRIVGAEEGGDDKQTIYVYPGHNSELDKYVLTALWNGTERSTELIDDKGTLLGGRIPRNTQVNVVITLKSDNKLELNCTVLPWRDGGSSDIEYDEAFSASIEQISDNKVVGDTDDSRAYAVIYGYPDEELTFELTVRNPKGATWTANVTNGLDFEVKKADGSWASGGIDGKPVTLVVRPKRSFEVGKTRETELYITLTQNMENRGEQIINNPVTHPGTTTRIRIRQIAITDFNKLTR